MLYIYSRNKDTRTVKRGLITLLNEKMKGKQVNFFKKN